MKYTIVGDVHGKSLAVEQALSKEGTTIFVGDFIDSFKASAEEHDRCFQLVIDAIEKGKARAIYGNHELSYLMENPHRCSGWDYYRKLVMDKWEPKIRALFEPFILLEPQMLVSHAGFTKRLWDDNNLTLESLPQALAEWWPDPRSPMHQIGRCRGGVSPYGGLFWCDFDAEFEPVEVLTQVFGHTRGKGIRTKGDNNFCIDCLDKDTQFLDIEISNSLT